MVSKKQRAQKLEGTTTKIRTGCGSLYVILNRDNNEPLEVFAKLGKAGGCASCFLEGVTRCISLGLKYGVPLREFVDELIEIQCPTPFLDNRVQVKSCIDALGKVLKERLKE